MNALKFQRLSRTNFLTSGGRSFAVVELSPESLSVKSRSHQVSDPPLLIRCQVHVANLRWLWLPGSGSDGKVASPSSWPSLIWSQFAGLPTATRACHYQTFVRYHSPQNLSSFANMTEVSVLLRLYLNVCKVPIHYGSYRGIILQDFSIIDTVNDKYRNAIYIHYNTHLKLVTRTHLAAFVMLYDEMY